MSAPSEWLDFGVWIGGRPEGKEPAFVLRVRTDAQLYALVEILKASLPSGTALVVGGWRE